MSVRSRWKPAISGCCAGLLFGTFAVLIHPFWLAVVASSVVEIAVIELIRVYRR